METFKLKTHDGKQLYCRYEEAENARALLLIVHGMSESGKRYSDFMEYLAARGVSSFCPDLRAHGNTAESVERVGLSEYGEDAFEDSAGDIAFLAAHLKNSFPSLPLFILGHSYGSFLLQSFLSKGGGTEGIILSGTSYFDTALNRAGGLIAGIGKRFRGGDAPAKLIRKMSFGAYAKQFKDASWLSRDPEVMQAYAADPFNCRTFSYAFYRSFFRGGLSMYGKARQATLYKAAPVLIIGGTHDPVGQRGNGPKRLAEYYRNAGLGSVELKLYEAGRHEMLNETNREEVFSDIAEFINAKIAKQRGNS